MTDASDLLTWALEKETEMTRIHVHPDGHVEIVVNEPERLAVAVPRLVEGWPENDEYQPMSPEERVFGAELLPRHGEPTGWGEAGPGYGKAPVQAPINVSDLDDATEEVERNRRELWGEVGSLREASDLLRLAGLRVQTMSFWDQDRVRVQAAIKWARDLVLHGKITPFPSIVDCCSRIGGPVLGANIDRQWERYHHALSWLWECGFRARPALGDGHVIIECEVSPKDAYNETVRLRALLTKAEWFIFEDRGVTVSWDPKDAKSIIRIDDACCGGLTAGPSEHIVSKPSESPPTPRPEVTADARQLEGFDRGYASGYADGRREWMAAERRHVVSADLPRLDLPRPEDRPAKNPEDT